MCQTLLHNNTKSKEKSQLKTIFCGRNWQFIQMEHDRNLEGDGHVDNLKIFFKLMSPV
jgi:Ran GTPase-activating protein (RanGAP) involved in mRNA processing and transport